MKTHEFESLPGPEMQLAPDDIVVSTGLTSDQVIDAAKRGVRHVIQRSGICFEKEMALAHEMLTTPEEFFKNPIKSILRTDPPADALLLSADALINKSEVLDQLRDFMATRSKSRSVRDEALAASDEIFTNASKNSGVFYQKANENQGSAGKIEFCAHIDDDRLTIICSDSYGLLKVEPVLNRIGNVFRDGVAAAIQQGSGGAGIGSFMIFNSCSSYYLGVDAGKKTVVACTFQLVPRAKDKTVLPKNIHWVSIG